MPQMKPMYWLILMIYFLVMYLCMNMILYYISMKKLMKDKKIMDLKMFELKW
uniref:ATP synthase F0 subunit 8 n=1 Tax=Prosaspicera validispina TaxID=2943453 RepID=A0A9E8GDG8_9HYME|nr:ATP synthase F0 subunit 8 [Prosaspicera validispina]